MGEVGNTLTEDPPVQLKTNGELNGNHAEEPDEAMDIAENHSVAVDLKKVIKDGDNEPEVPLATNGKEKKSSVELNISKDVMEIDENESLNGDLLVTSQPEEITIPGHGDNSEDGTIDSEKDALELPEDLNNKMDTNPVILSDSSDEDSGSEDENSSSTSKFQSAAERSAAVSESEGISNGAISTNHSRVDDDDDKPVSIHSDSDEKDDCIMIDDVAKKGAQSSEPTSENTSPRRARKSAVHPMTDFDDDIEEIVEDPLEMESNPAKRIKLSGTTITSVDLSRPSSSSSASSAYPVNLSTNSRSSSGSSQALNLTKKSGNSLLNPFATQAAQSTSSSSSNSMLLPNLTDDMFVLEAPSFIVPYIYEKPPTTSLKTVVQDIAKTILKRETEKRRVDEESGAESELNNQKSTESSDVDDKKNKSKSKSKSRRRGATNGDESWDEYNTSTDDEASDGEKRTKVLIKESHDDIESIKTHIISPDTISQSIIGENKNDSYFESPLGKFFMTIGVNLVQEYVQSDLLRQQKRRREKEGKAPSAATQMAINSLQKSLEVSKENNAPFKNKMKRCDFCAFKTESEIILSQHYEIPHFKNNIYKCNYCEYEARPVHDILYHMEAIHNIKGRLEKPLSYHQCPNCPFEDNGKSKMVRHEAACLKKYKPEVNLCPPLDWEPPAKIPRIKAKHGLVGAATAYQAMAAQQQQRVAQANAVAANISSLQRNNTAVMAAAMKRGRQQNVTKQQNNSNSLRNDQFKNFNANILSNNYQLAAATLAAANTQFLQQVVAQKLAMLNPAAAAAAGNSFLPSLANASSSKSKSSSSTPSISITPLPRQQQQQAGIKPGQSPNASGGKPQFVICEICDGYIKDLDQLRNHMQWIHKVKIHPKMIYNRPPLNCQKCQYRFFTDQGLERHLLGSHGLVTSSMQEAANNGKDSGRCPVCGKVFQWKLLNHVSRDHNMTLKPAHLSYKCTVCTATFGMYKLFENHVYSAHSTVAKKDNKNKSSTSTAGSSSSNNSLLKPLRINDEITIIPQPAKKMNDMESHIID